MSDEQIIEILRELRRSESLTFQQKQALAWCIAKLLP